MKKHWPWIVVSGIAAIVFFLLIRNWWKKQKQEIKSDLNEFQTKVCDALDEKLQQVKGDIQRQIQDSAEQLPQLPKPAGPAGFAGLPASDLPTRP